MPQRFLRLLGPRFVRESRKRLGRYTQGCISGMQEIYKRLREFAAPESFLFGRREAGFVPNYRTGRTRGFTGCFGRGSGAEGEIMPGVGEFI